ncbi:related to Cell division control protein 73 [Saccharomycodes ludwigii]|uniref:Related to Cell division control protein 73 n=1 Tax=Saccharomycodes ludwigii TaxID=36035 RepID=A0A376B6T4_9ASCO|nr:related to Cell division control protein 73 [Saccharomycodes ludwigii]
MINLESLRKAIIDKYPIKLLNNEGTETKDILEAAKLSINNNGSINVLGLDEKTDFIVDAKEPITLRVVYHCWMNKNTSAADYLVDCKTKKIPSISFLQRTDLVNWLSGETEISKYIKRTNGAENHENNKSVVNDVNITDTAGRFPVNESIERNTDVTTENSGVMDALLTKERILLDHNSFLRGKKPINFEYLIKEVELNLVRSLKQHNEKAGHKSKVHKSASGPLSIKQSGRKIKEPIIIIPSAASSPFTMANIRQFLLEGKYIAPKDLPTINTDIIKVEKKLDGMKHPIKFIIVNNTRLFNKPEYWSRVLAVFTTGHAWQFDNYQWSDPIQLFQHTKGYYFCFSGDTVPKSVQQWNVQKIELDKTRRFKDLEVCRYFWNSLEKELQQRGYH